MEIYKDIPDYEGFYSVSNKGNVMSFAKGRKRLLKLTPNKTGYISVTLTKNKVRRSILVHQLVAMGFLNHTPCGHDLVVDHIDSDKLNNKLNNLQVITNRENCSKDRKNKTSKYSGVYWDKNNNNWRTQTSINGKTFHIGSFTNEEDAYNAYVEKIKVFNLKNENE